MDREGVSADTNTAQCVSVGGGIDFLVVGSAWRVSVGVLGLVL